jgi:hypothetical protein
MSFERCRRLDLIVSGTHQEFRTSHFQLGRLDSRRTAALAAVMRLDQHAQMGGERMNSWGMP